MNDLDPGCLLFIMIALAVGGATAYDCGNHMTGIASGVCALFIAVVLVLGHRADRRRVASPKPPTSKPSANVESPTPPPTSRRG